MRTRPSILIFSSVLALILGVQLLRGEVAADQQKPASCIPSKKDPNRHEQFLKDKAAQLEKGPIQVVFEGDSITDGWRGGGKKVWKEYYSKYNTLNLGIGGDRTEHVLWRVQHGELDGLDPKVVVMMIGTNNIGSSVSDIVAGITCDVKAIHEKLPNTKILLLGVFPRSPKPTDNARPKIKEVNEAISKLDGTDPKSIMPDALHPNEKGYYIWAKAMQPTLDELMK